MKGMKNTKDPLSCPTCQSQMTRERFGKKIYVDVCTVGCGGVWFDRHELEGLDHMTKGKGKTLLRALAEARVDDTERGPIRCPRGHGEMRRRQHEFVATVTLDECVECRGIFLDAGELALIRNRPLTAQEQVEYRRRWRELRERTAGDSSLDAGDLLAAEVGWWTLMFLWM